MKTLRYALLTLLVVFGTSAFATPQYASNSDEGGTDEEWDDFLCRNQTHLVGMGLQCISCGVQKYYSDHGRPNIVPSEKWISLLAVGARNFKNIESSPDGKRHMSTGGYGSIEMDNMKKVVIHQIQAYGFCVNYISKDAKNVTGGKNYRDLTAAESKYVTQAAKRALKEDDLNDVSKFFGFKQSKFLFFETSDHGAIDGAKTFFDDANLNDATTVFKREVFKKKLNDALNDYDISGEKKQNREEIIAAGDKDNGLRQCLEEVQRRLQSPEYKTANTELCQTMAAQCEVEDSVCNDPNPNGGGSVGVPQPKRKGGGKLPPPPMGDGRGGIN